MSTTGRKNAVAYKMYLYPFSTCEGLLVMQITQLAPVAFGGFSSSCISWLPNYAFSRITGEQLSYLSAEAVGGTYQMVLRIVSDA